MSLPDDLVAALESAARAGTLLVASDFDGVLAPLVLDPSTSRPLPGTVEALRGLAGLPDTYAAVVSGRDLETLTALTGLEGSDVSRVGSHGAESSAEGSTDLSEQERETLAALTRDLQELAGRVPGLGLEHKPSAVVAHTRGMQQPASDEAERAVAEVAARHEGLTVMRGKHVVEMSVHDADKGTAVAGLRADAGADAVVYLGDDVTDENVFRRFGEGDVGVKVGDGPTAAGFRVAEPQDAAEVLGLLLDRRRTAVG